MTTANEWTYGTDADDQPAEPYEAIDARCSCGWSYEGTARDEVVRIATDHRRTYGHGHETSIGPVELHGDRLAASATPTPDPRPFGRRRRIALAHLILRAAALLIVTVVDRRATVQTSVSTFTVERLERPR